MQRKRILWFDVVRTIAILLVVLTHSYEAFHIDDMVIRSIFSYVTRNGVPLFFMISGALILPNVHKLKIIDFYKKRIPQFLILIIVYSLLTTIAQKFVYEDLNIDSLKEIISSENGIAPAHNGAAMQLWYLYTIIGIYLVAPFMSTMLANISTERVLWFIILCTVLNFLSRGLIARVGTDFTGAYITYYIWGYYVVDRDRFKFNGEWQKYAVCISLVVIPMVAGVVYNVLSNEFDEPLSWYSTSLIILVSSSALFVLLKNVFEDRKISGVFTFVAGNAFGVFLINIIVMFFVNKYIVVQFCSSLGILPQVFISFALTFMVSFVISYLMGYSKVTRYLSH